MCCAKPNISLFITRALDALLWSTPRTGLESHFLFGRSELESLVENICETEEYNNIIMDMILKSGSKLPL